MVKAKGKVACWEYFDIIRIGSKREPGIDTARALAQVRYSVLLAVHPILTANLAAEQLFVRLKVFIMDN